MDWEKSEKLGRKVLLSGASGMLGRAIGQALRGRGILTPQLVRAGSGEESRSGTQDSEKFLWDPAKGVFDTQPLEGISAAVHLSGANVSSGRWTKDYKREMIQSRVGTTCVLAEGLARMKRPPAVLVTASAVGFYGNRGNAILDEASEAGEGFFAELCQGWEGAARSAVEAGIRVVHLRFGVVLGPDGGALAKLGPMFRYGLGGRLGDGRQWMSWVSEADAVGAALFALDLGSLSGPVNATAPEPVTNAVFTQELGRAVHRPTVFNAPAFGLRMVFGEMADEALLASARVLPKRLLAEGYEFQYPTLRDALQAALVK